MLKLFFSHIRLLSHNSNPNPQTEVLQKAAPKAKQTVPISDMGERKRRVEKCGFNAHRKQRRRTPPVQKTSDLFATKKVVYRIEGEGEEEEEEVVVEEVELSRSKQWV
jgi:hypothetical protein